MHLPRYWLKWSKIHWHRHWLFSGRVCRINFNNSNSWISISAMVVHTPLFVCMERQTPCPSFKVWGLFFRTYTFLVLPQFLPKTRSNTARLPGRATSLGWAAAGPSELCTPNHPGSAPFTPTQVSGPSVCSACAAMCRCHTRAGCEPPPVCLPAEKEDVDHSVLQYLAKCENWITLNPHVLYNPLSQSCLSSGICGRGWMSSPTAAAGCTPQAVALLRALSSVSGGSGRRLSPETAELRPFRRMSTEKNSFFAEC